MFNWQQKGWPKARVDKAALKDELDSFRTAFANVKDALRKPQDHKAVIRTGDGAAIRYQLDFDIGKQQDVSLHEPLSMAINEAIKSEPGINKPRLMELAGKSKATIERAVAALIAAGKIEHRGSKKTGGYYPI